MDVVSNNYNLINNSLLVKYRRLVKSPDFAIKLFKRDSCQITIDFLLWLKTYDFLNLLSLSFNRRALAIFFGNALPSFTVVLANLLSIKVIYFSKNLKNLKATTRTDARKHRLQNDLRAFLVILIESFSVIMISWAIPIFLTLYHCNKLYVIHIETCPQIKDHLALFLFSDLFNSSTNCLLYSLSGKLFRRKFISLLKTIVTCGRGKLWNVRQDSLDLASQRLHRQPLANLSTTININNNQNSNKKSLIFGSNRHQHFPLTFVSVRDESH